MDHGIGRRIARALAWGAAAAVIGGLAGCGGSSTTAAQQLPPGFYITIRGMAFAPLNLDAPPGATVTVLNQDGMQHSVTSEATSGAFTPGAVAGVSFDTQPFTGSASFTLPSSAAEGTVIPYYCVVHKGTMATPNGTITVKAAAQPSPAPTQPTPSPGPGY